MISELLETARRCLALANHEILLDSSDPNDQVNITERARLFVKEVNAAIQAGAPLKEVLRALPDELQAEPKNGQPSELKVAIAEAQASVRRAIAVLKRSDDFHNAN